MTKIVDLNSFIAGKGSYVSGCAKIFEYACLQTFSHEGEYVNHPSDPGGETKFGITKRDFPYLDIKNLQHKDAIVIYYFNYWKPAKCDSISNQSIAAKYFDMCVNMGQSQAVKLAQRACRACGCNTVDDGVIGPQTIAAMNASAPAQWMASIKSEMAGFYRLLAATNPKNQVFLEGWLNRAYSA